MKLSDLQFDLPQDLIAQVPAEPRESARLWVETVGDKLGIESRVGELPKFLKPKDLLVFNNTRVLPARLWAHRASGGRVELLFLEPTGANGEWLAMVRPAKKPKRGELLAVAEGVSVHMVERMLDAAGSMGPYWRVALVQSDSKVQAVEHVLERWGEMPLPPYIQRPQGGDASDRERYQTIFAREPGAVAAPTAGLHFSLAMLQAIREAGIRTTQVTLHVGLGTFLPIQVDDLDDHMMHEERYSVTPDAVRAVEECKAQGGRVIAVGTTSARALEAAWRKGTLEAGQGRTNLFVRPGYSFGVVDGLLTNFHLPGSTLLLLVSALVGRERLLEIYQHAILQRWRFYSYGDAMLILPSSGCSWSS